MDPSLNSDHSQSNYFAMLGSPTCFSVLQTSFQLNAYIACCFTKFLAFPHAAVCHNDGLLSRVEARVVAARVVHQPLRRSLGSRGFRDALPRVSIAVRR
jgi:hypothetical protein